ncbi:hypothetical protein EDB84DRAFT_1566047 [Lactarius hengduanensis]|nr:hypothetical protein EDB84DRAFT_1566047 [Lactarius hengduanensis]
MDKEKVERKADLQVDAAESNLKGIDDDFRFHSIDTESYYVTDSDPDSNPDSDSDEDEDEGKVEGNKDEGEDQEAGETDDSDIKKRKRKRKPNKGKGTCVKRRKMKRFISNSKGDKQDVTYLRMTSLEVDRKLREPTYFKYYSDEEFCHLKVESQRTPKGVDYTLYHSELESESDLSNQHVSDIGITDEHELAQWDLIICGVLNWAGTLPDAFGTNEHADLLGTVQALWDKCLPERTEDVRINPAIKHVVIGCLNEWRSTIGKKAVTILGDFIKHDVTLSNSSEVATFVRALLPHPREHPIAFPFIYADSEASKGSWLAPLLLQVFAVHLRRVVKAPTNFGYPAGALALCTAALERGLSLFKTGDNIQDEAADDTGHAFDIDPWGGIACQYSQSICDLRERKWVQILHAASVYLGPSDTEISVIPDGRSRIVVSDDE